MNVYLYILDTLADWEIAFISAELNSKRFTANSGKQYSFIKVGNSMESITSMGGMKITPDITVEDLKLHNGDLLILPGADTWNDKNNHPIIEITAKFLQSEVIIAAICGATSALANRGLLNKRRHTSNDKEFLKLTCPNYKGSDYYVNKPAVCDDNLITASGFAALEFTYEIIKKTGLMRANTVEAWYSLNKTKEPRYFFQLMDTLK